MRLISVMILALWASVAQGGEPDHGTTVTVEHDGLSYAAQFWTDSDKIVVVSLPEADLRPYPPATAERVAAQAMAAVGMSCALGAAVPDQYGLPPGTTWDVPYRC